jgi:hypothetical protein
MSQVSIWCREWYLIDWVTVPLRTWEKCVFICAAQDLRSRLITYETRSTTPQPIRSGNHTTTLRLLGKARRATEGNFEVIAHGAFWACHAQHTSSHIDNLSLTTHYNHCTTIMYTVLINNHGGWPKRGHCSCKSGGHDHDECPMATKDWKIEMCRRVICLK